MLGYRTVKGHILTLLGLVRQRPAMYVHVAERDCRVQLSHVQALIAGYVLALRQHGIGDEDIEVVAQLENYMVCALGCTGRNFVEELYATSTNEPDALDRFWALVDEFSRQVTGAG